MSRPNQSAAWPELTAILMARLSVLWLLILISLPLSHGDTAFYAVMGIAFTITIPYSLWLRSKLHSDRLAPQPFLADLVLISGLICLTGGLHSDLTLLYPLVILAVGIYVSKRCSYLSGHAQDARNAVRTMLENLAAGILMLDRQGRILSANPAACDLLQATQKQLAAITFPELCVSGLRPVPERYGPSAYLERTHAPPLPVALRRADVELPVNPLPGLDGKEAAACVTLVVLTDLSVPLKLERQIERMERVAAATRIAGEMAHDIRIPLTTISASIQLLQHYEIHPVLTEGLPDSPRKKDRIELFDHILGASEKMDTVIQNFVDFAEFSPKDLLSIIKLDSSDENEGYIGHINTIEKGFENGQNSDSGRRSDNPKLVEQNPDFEGI